MSFIDSRLTGASLRDLDKGFGQARVVCQLETQKLLGHEKLNFDKRNTHYICFISLDGK
jgi:hypothetical protein